IGLGNGPANLHGGRPSALFPPNQSRGGRGTSSVTILGPSLAIKSSPLCSLASSVPGAETNHALLRAVFTLGHVRSVVPVGAHDSRENLFAAFRAAPTLPHARAKIRSSVASLIETATYPVGSMFSTGL